MFSNKRSQITPQVRMLNTEITRCVKGDENEMNFFWRLLGFVVNLSFNFSFKSSLATYLLAITMLTGKWRSISRETVFSHLLEQGLSEKGIIQFVTNDSYSLLQLS